jgi:hypothetical protein
MMYRKLNEVVSVLQSEDELNNCTSRKSEASFIPCKDVGNVLKITKKEEIKCKSKSQMM